MRSIAIGTALFAAGLALAAGETGPRHGATIQHRFEDPERWAAVFDDPARDAWQKPEDVVAALGVGPGDRVADLGAGTGYFSVRLARAVGDTGAVYAVDIESSLVEHIRSRAEEAGLPQVVPVLTKPDDPGLPDDGVDFVLVCNTWHHIDDRLEYLTRLASALRPGGRVAVVDFREGDLPVGPPAGHKLSRDDVVGEFAEGGWQLAEEHDFLPYQYFLVFVPDEG